MICPTLHAGHCKTGQAVTLEAPNLRFAEWPFEMVSNPELMQYFMLGRPPFQPNEFGEYKDLMESILGHSKRFAWWIWVNELNAEYPKHFADIIATRAPEEDTLLGEQKSCKLYYAVRQDWQGKGIAQAAIAAAARHVLFSGKVDAVKVEILTVNTPSLKAAERAGFEHRLTKPNDFTEYDGKVYDVWHGYATPDTLARFL